MFYCKICTVIQLLVVKKCNEYPTFITDYRFNNIRHTVKYARVFKWFSFRNLE